MSGKIAEKKAIIISMISYDNWEILNLDQLQPVLGSRGRHATSRAARSVLGFQALPNDDHGEKKRGAVMIDIFNDVKIARVCGDSSGVFYRAFNLNVSTDAILDMARVFNKAAYLFRDTTAESVIKPKDKAQARLVFKAESDGVSTFDANLSDVDLAKRISELIKIRDERIAKLHRIYGV